MNYNKVTLGGTIGNDIELRTTSGGLSVADISLAVNRKYTKDGQPEEETTWVEITLWGRSAEIVHQYSGKGHPLFVEGRLQLSSWTNKETGEKRSKLKVVADNVQLLNKREKGSNDQPAVDRQQGNYSKTPSNPQSQTPTSNESEDGIPF